jgi:hypothetical protein
MTEEQIADMLRKGYEPGLERVHMPEMGGYGVVATKAFYKGDFVCEYSGDLITLEEVRACVRALLSNLTCCSVTAIKSSSAAL